MNTDNPSQSIELPPLPARIVEIACVQTLTLLEAVGSSEPVALISAPGAGLALGGPWWRALMQDNARPHILDCGTAAAVAAWAMRHGQAYVVFSGAPAQRRALGALAKTCGAHVLDTRPDALSLGLPPYSDYHCLKLTNFLASATP